MPAIRLISMCLCLVLATAGWTAEKVTAEKGAAVKSSVENDSVPSPLSLSSTGALLTSSNDLPTASGERLAQAFAVEVPSQISGGALLVDGDILVGNAISLQAGVASIASGAFGLIQVPAADLAAVLVAPTSAASPARSPKAFTGAILVSGERVAGQPTFLNPTHAGVDNGKRVVQIPRERVAALVMQPVRPMTKPVVRLGLATGDRISGSVTAAADGAWSLQHALGTWTIPRYQIGSWWTEGAERTALSALQPLATYRDDLDPPLVPMRLDQDSEGTWLRLGTTRFDRGMMLRAGTTAAFTIEGSWKSLVAVMGVAHGGPAVVRVMQGQKTLWDSGPLTAGAAARPCVVSLQGVTSLSISVVAPDTNLPDKTGPGYVVIGWPYLLK